MKKLILSFLLITSAASVNGATLASSYPYITTNPPPGTIRFGTLTAETITNLIRAAIVDLDFWGTNNNTLIELPLYASDTNGNYKLDFTNSNWILTMTNDLTFYDSTNWPSSGSPFVRVTTIRVQNTSGADHTIDYNSDFHVMGGMYTNLPNGNSLLLSAITYYPFGNTNVLIGWATDDPNYTVAVVPDLGEGSGDGPMFDTNLVQTMISDTNTTYNFDFKYDTNGVIAQIAAQILSSNVFNFDTNLVAQMIQDTNNSVFPTNGVRNEITNIHNALGGGGDGPMYDTNGVMTLITNIHNALGGGGDGPMFDTNWVTDYVEASTNTTTTQLISYIGASTNTLATQLISYIGASTNTATLNLISYIDASTNTLWSQFVSYLTASTNTTTTQLISYIGASTNTVQTQVIGYSDASTNTLGTQLISTINSTSNSILTAVRTNYLYIPAGAWVPPTSGSAAFNTNSVSSIFNDIYCFDDTTAESLQVSFPIQGWNLSTMTYKVYMTSTNATSVAAVWDLAIGAISSSESMGVTLGTAVKTTNTWAGTANQLNISAVSGAVTVGSTPAKADLLQIKLQRLPTDAGDNMGGDACMLGLMLQYTSTNNPTW